MFKLWTRLFRRFHVGPWRGGEVMFSRPRRQPLQELVSFWADNSLYEDIRLQVGSRDASRFLRACLRLGLGLFRECPELMQELDKRGRKERSMSVWVDEGTYERLLIVSQGQKSQLIRASVEFGLVHFQVHPEHISMLDGGGRD
ncbi:MAG: hypothetical protein FD177_867 [Desulfovibrionaceae bacterium]|nr:MAG: hypothetical protein FD177_867 [Desulfovibrionaceae bacterium]